MNLLISLIGALAFIDIIKCLKEINENDRYNKAKEEGKYFNYSLKFIIKMTLTAGEDIFLCAFVLWFFLQ